jgi:hypothetical protein
MRQSSDSRVINGGSKKRNSHADQHRTDGEMAAKPILTSTDNGIDDTDTATVRATPTTTPATNNARNNDENSNVRQTHV